MTNNVNRLVETVAVLTGATAPLLQAKSTASPLICTPILQDHKEHGVCIADGLMTENGYIWPRSVWEQIQARLNSDHPPLVSYGFGEGIGVSLDLVAGRMSHLHIVDVPGPERYQVYAKFHLYESIPYAELVRHFMATAELYLMPVGGGRIDENCNIYEFGLSYFALTGTSKYRFAQPLNALALS